MCGVKGEVISMDMAVKFKGVPMRLAGRAIRVGMEAPDFRCVSRDMKEMRLSDFGDRVRIVTSFPSLDTPVCDLQVKEFNARAASLSPEVVILGISKDLPFAQKRFCDAHGIDKVELLSDYKYSSFGVNFGLLIRELNLLARSVVIVDRSNVIGYIQVVGELTAPPDYDGALKALEGILEKRGGAPAVALPGRCIPCEGGVPPLSAEEIGSMSSRIPGWKVVDGKRIVRELIFKDFSEARSFLDLVALIADEQGHHPDMTISYRRLTLSLTTHAAGGLTANDFIMAGIIDELRV